MCKPRYSYLISPMRYLEQADFTPQHVKSSRNFELKIVIIFLPISLNMCCWCSKEPSHRDGSFEYPQHMFWLRNKKLIFSYAPLSGGLPLTFLPLMCEVLYHFLPMFLHLYLVCHVLFEVSDEFLSLLGL